VGYTPLFDSLTRGTLCGRWPDIGLWPIVLSLADKNGVVDVTAGFLAGVTGLPLSDVEACMKRFCEPDPYSRSQDFAGARLALLDEHRPWGWQVINHNKYREKARLQAKSEREVAAGKNAARMLDRRGPPETAADPLSNSNSYKEEEAAKAATPVTNHRARKPASNKSALPPDFELNGEMLSCALEHLPNVDAKKFFAGFCDKAKAKGWKYVDWQKAWQVYVRNCAPNSGHFAANDYPRASGRGFVC
jgi:hypothetical protein